MSIPYIRLPFVLLALMGGPGSDGNQPPHDDPPEKNVSRFYYSIYLGEGVRDFARLDVLRSGKVLYYFASDPSSDSGGQVVRKAWQIMPEEASSLIADFKSNFPKADASAKGKPFRHHLKIGREFNRTKEDIEREVYVAALPARFALILLPLLQEAHPELWKQKTCHESRSGFSLTFARARGY